MLKQIAWNTFKTTGNINTMLELLEVDKTLDEIKNKEKQNSIIDNYNVKNNYNNENTQRLIIEQFNDALKKANNNLENKNNINLK